MIDLPQGEKDNILLAAPGSAATHVNNVFLPLFKASNIGRNSQRIFKSAMTQRAPVGNLRILIRIRATVSSRRLLFEGGATVVAVGVGIVPLSIGMYLGRATSLVAKSSPPMLNLTCPYRALLHPLSAKSRCALSIGPVRPLRLMPVD